MQHMQHIQKEHEIHGFTYCTVTQNMLCLFYVSLSLSNTTLSQRILYKLWKFLYRLYHLIKGFKYFNFFPADTVTSSIQRTTFQTLCLLVMFVEALSSNSDIRDV